MPHATRLPRPACSAVSAGAARRTALIAHAAFVSAVVALAAALVLVAGCGSDKQVNPVLPKGPQLPPGTPPNTAPDNTVLRWLTAYAWQVEGEADTLLTSDFHYHFSAQTDTSLVTVYGLDGWGKANEAVSFDHFCHGFRNAHGDTVQAATSVTYQVQGLSVNPDPAHQDSTAWYRSANLTQLAMEITTPYQGGTVYEIASAGQVLVVRGDAAVLNAGQKADSTRWYVRQYDDLAVSTYAARRSAPAAMPLPAPFTTWGKVRARYYR